MKRSEGINKQVIVLSIGVFLFFVSALKAQDFGGIRGTVYDKDFDVPLYAVKVQITETGETAMTDQDGNYFFSQVKSGTYTLLFTKDGFISQSLSNVAVLAGQISEANTSIIPEYTTMEEFVVEELSMDSGSEIGIINIRWDNSAMLSGISSELISQSGKGDAAEILQLVPGATVEEGKYPVIRGLPDRYVNSQLNGVRLPSADPDKRAVQLDQFPSALIESIQVSKTFTPDQQGDASGGAVNVITKSIPEERVFEFSSQIGFNTQTTGINDFLTYQGGGVDFWGIDDGGRDIQYDNIGKNWAGAVGTSRGNAPINYKWSLSGGGKNELDNGAKIGGFATFFYEHNSSFFDNGIDDSFWVAGAGNPMTPQTGTNGSPSQGKFTTSLFDVTQGSEEVKWGTLGTLGWETDDHSLSLLYMYTRSAEDTATLAEDTTGKASLHKYWPEYFGPEYDNYDRYDPTHPANLEPDLAPYIRTQTLQYTERTTQSIQFKGTHKLLNDDFEYNFRDYFKFNRPELDWGISFNTSELFQPDKRQFGSVWYAEHSNPSLPSYIYPAQYAPYKPSSDFYFGALQRIWKDIKEDDKQYSLNLKFPFEQWNENEGYLKFGFFEDNVKRTYNQDTFSNFYDNARSNGEWENYWTDKFSSENHPITAGEADVDYEGKQDITALYYMFDMPLNSKFKFIGGHRFENTKLTVINDPEAQAKWTPPGGGSTLITPGFYPNGADAKFEQDDFLPSIGFEYSPAEDIKFRGSYSETVARQTFKELTPIQQMEYLGADVFVGYPGLKMSSLKNYDLRLDYSPYAGGLWSFSYFYKDIKDPIEYIQAFGDFVFTTPRNYPEGKMSGVEFEIRQDAGQYWENFEGLTVGGNATFINSEVTLSDSEAAKFSQPNIMAPMSKRDMTNAPEHLYNLYMTYDLEQYKTQLALFYTVRGDTLVAGAGQSQSNFVPNIYDTEYGTLNLSLAYDLKENCKLKFQAKNLTNPAIEQVYRSKYIGNDVTKTSYKKGLDFTLSLAYKF